MDKQELKPCPFCGGEAEYHGECEMVVVRCSLCGATRSGWWDESEDAAREWNSRTDEQVEALTVEELREMDGQPVFTETIGLIGSGRWELIHFDEHWAYFKTVYEDYKMTYEEFDGSYGQAWLAYRTRPTEDGK